MTEDERVRQEQLKTIADAKAMAADEPHRRPRREAPTSTWSPSELRLYSDSYLESGATPGGYPGDADQWKREAKAETQRRKDASVRRRRKLKEEIELREEDKRREAAEEALAVRGGLTHVIPAPASELRASTVKVGSEALVYGPGSAFGWFKDVFLARTALMGTALPSREIGHTVRDVLDRLHRSNRQMASLARTTERARELYRTYFIEKHRPYHGTVSDHSGEAFRNFVFGWAETRAVSTTTSSMGDFAPPLYLLDEWLKYRTAASPVASQSAQRDIPATGMTVDIPNFGAKVTMAVQAGENEALATSSPTAGYRSAPVKTIAGQVKVSQQYLDRVGPGVAGDLIIAERAAREAATVLDQLTITVVKTAIPTANKLTNAGAAPSIATLYADLGKANSLLLTTEGTRLPMTRVFLTPQLQSWYESQLDTQKRPIWSPDAGGRATPGAVTSATEGDSGYSLMGARVFNDANLPVASTNVTLLVGNPGRACIVFTGTPIVDVFPEFKPDALTALVTIRQYVAVDVTYPAGWASITSTSGAYPLSPTFANS